MRARLIVPAVRPGGRFAAAVIAAALSLTAGALGAQATSASANQPRVDTRWYPWLGCWQSDSDAVSATRARSRYTCVIPSARESAVDILSVVDGTVAARSHVDADNRAHPITQAGCQGDETATWSANYHRLYLRSNYTCAGVQGTSSRMFAIASGGDWLEVEGISAGGGSIDHVTRRHDVGLVSGVPAEVARALSGRNLAIATARAAAAAPAAATDVIEAVHATDASVARGWIVESNTRFHLDAADATALVHADVPTSVLQAMMGETRLIESNRADEANRAADDYLRSTSVANTIYLQPGGEASAEEAAQAAMQTYPICNAAGCYSPMPYTPYSAFNYPYPFSVLPVGGSLVGAPFTIFRRGSFPMRNRPNVPIHRGPVGIPRVR